MQKDCYVTSRDFNDAMGGEKMNMPKRKRKENVINV